MTKYRKNFTVAEIKFAKENSAKGVRFLAGALGRNEGSVCKLLVRLNIRTGISERRSWARPFNEKERAFLLKNYASLGAERCAVKLDRCKTLVKREAARLKLGKLKQDMCRESLIDISKFTGEIEKEMAYFLGLLWADGHVSKSGYCASLQMKREDFDEILKVLNQVGQFHIRYRPAHRRGNRNSSESGTASTNHRGLLAFLTENGYKAKSNSEPIKILNLLGEEVKRYWWRGCFDGDGCWSVDKAGRYSVSISGAYGQSWTAASALFDSLDIKYAISQTLTKTGNYSEIAIDNFEGFQKLGNYIYDETYDGIGLRRKFDKFRSGLALKKKHGTNLLLRSVPVAVYTRDWRYITTYKSIEDASRQLNMRAARIREYFQFKRGHTGGYQMKKLSYNKDGTINEQNK